MTKRLMLALLFSCSPLWATTYYVDNCVTVGNDRNNGTSASTPWLTVNKVNTSKLNPGDSILLESTCTWREQLTPPSSGSSGNPITFGSYGTGALPIISGSALLTSWTNTSGNVWQVSLSTQPSQIFFNGKRGTEVSSEASVISVNDWYWASDVLYVYSTSNPATAFTSPGIEASQWNYNIQLGSYNYLTIQNLRLTESNQFGIFQYGPVGGTLTQTITGNTIDRAYYSGITLGTTGSLYTSLEISNNSVSQCGADGIQLNAYIQSATVEHNTVFSNNLLYTPGGTDPYLEFLAGIHFNGNGTNIKNVVVQYNLVYSNGPPYATGNAGNGIWFDTIHDSNTVARYNLLYGNTANGIMIENANGNQALYNISYSNGEAGIWVQNSDGTATGNQAVGLYNNTVFGNTVAGVLLQGDYLVASTCTNNSVKNNISSGNTGPNLSARYGCENVGISGSGNVYTYNDFGPQATDFIEWGGHVYKSTYAMWETATGNCGTTGCSHSVQADPQFVNAAASQFWLASGSPAIGAGLNLGSPYNIGLMPGSTWPNSVVTGDQNAYGSGWEIGAFVYVPPVALNPPSNLHVVSAN
jgi:hypothetical protein